MRSESDWWGGSREPLRVGSSGGGRERSGGSKGWEGAERNWQEQKTKRKQRHRRNASEWRSAFLPSSREQTSNNTRYKPIGGHVITKNAKDEIHSWVTEKKSLHFSVKRCYESVSLPWNLIKNSKKRPSLCRGCFCRPRQEQAELNVCVSWELVVRESTTSFTRFLFSRSNPPIKAESR